MSATEVQKPTVEQPLATAKPVKEKKPKAPKEKKPQTTKTVAHPPYLEMIKEALLALKEKGGSSPYAIAKYMEEKHKGVLPANFRKIMSLQLKNSVAKGKLIKIKASYKLSGSAEKSKPAAARTKRKAAVVMTTKAEGLKKAASKKVPKKAATAKPKQPKSIKSPASVPKKAKKVA